MTDRATTTDKTSYMPSPLALFKLREFGAAITDCIGETPYLVGSILRERSGWRDVDVRVMVDDETFAAIFGEDDVWITNGRLRLINMALSALGEQMTGLPVDCQIQQASEANAHYGGERRDPLIPLGAHPRRKAPR